MILRPTTTNTNRTKEHYRIISQEQRRFGVIHAGPSIDLARRVTWQWCSTTKMVQNTKWYRTQTKPGDVLQNAPSITTDKIPAMWNQKEDLVPI